MAKKVKKVKKESNGMTINVKSLCKEYTDLRVSDDVYREIKEYTSDTFIYKMVKLSEKFAKRDKKGTIQERDYLRAKDYLNYFIMQVDNYEPTD